MPKTKSKPNGIGPIPAKFSYANITRKRQSKHASIQFRSDLLRSQAQASYQNEYNRIHSMLRNHILSQTHPQRAILEHRQKHMKRLWDESVYPPEHEIYKRSIAN